MKWLKPIQVMIIGFHIFGFIVILLCDTAYHRALRGPWSVTSLWIPTVTLIAALLFARTARGPGYADEEEAPIISGENRGEICEICGFVPPLRAAHCHRCKRCVLRRDHHCPWFGVCIGQNNHFVFLWYTFFESLTFISFARQTFRPALNTSNTFVMWLSTSLLCAIVCAGSVFGAIQTCLLFPLHLLMAFMNITTREFIKGARIPYLRKWKENLSPFSIGLKGNITEFATMAHKQIIWSVPTEGELVGWKQANSFISNDKYECC